MIKSIAQNLSLTKLFLAAFVFYAIVAGQSILNILASFGAL